jgi:SpoVK/Ycf46/Vps4 family AAA+-type ATPase
VGRLLRDVAQRLSSSRPLPVWEWSLTEGLCLDNQPAQPGTQAPREALDFIAAHGEPAIFHLKDFHEPLRDSPEVRRRLRDIYELCVDQNKFVVVTSAVRFIPEEVERTVIFVDLRPPDLIELVDFVRDEIGRLGLGEDAEKSEVDLTQIARTLQGLTLDEARYALRRARAVSPHLGPESLPALLEEKRLLVNRSGVIEYIADGTSIGEVGGLEGLKKWLLERRKLFLMRESLNLEIVPKGILMMGIPGCGKSLCVKAIASAT